MALLFVYLIEPPLFLHAEDFVEKPSRKAYKRLEDDGKSPKVLVHTINGNQTTSIRKSELSGKNFGGVTAIDQLTSFAD
jgi:hypothetical protein